MIKRILLSFSLVMLSSAAFAQQGSASPYSYYGIGTVNENTTNEYKAMGGNSLYTDSIHINLKNPASLAKLKYTTFAVGATSKFYSFKTDQNSENVKRQTIDYLALAFPISKKAGIVFGVLPYSNTGYKVTGIDTNESGRITTNSFDGSGGTNKVFLGGGYKITSNLHIGVDAGYHFGSSDNNTYTWIKDRGDGIALATQTYENRELDYKGFSFNFAAQYEGTIGKYNWQANATYSPQTTWTVDNRTIVQVIDIYNPGKILNQKEISDESKDFTNPQNYSFGAGFGKERKWFVSGQFTYIENSKLGTSWNQTAISSFEDTKRYSVGGFYIPKYNSFTSYLSRVVYRAGMRYENTGLVLHNKSINDFAVSAGVGLPIGRSFTNLNIGIEYGQKGTSSNGLIKENYFNISVGISLNDLWFNRRRFE